MAQGGAAWQTEGEEGGEEGSGPRGGRTAAAVVVGAAGEAKAALIALPGAKSGA